MADVLLRQLCVFAAWRQLLIQFQVPLSNWPASEASKTPSGVVNAKSGALL